MRVFIGLLVGLLATFTTPFVLALECDNAAGGTAPAVAPDDTGDGDATACGRSATASGPSSMALGYSATSFGANSSAVGYLANSSGQSSSAVGLVASSAGDFSAAVGPYASSAGDSSIALGHEASVPASYSAALGYKAYADQWDTVIIGAVPGVNDAVAYAKVGMGTTAPSEAVDVERSSAAARFQLTSFTATGSEAPQYIQRRARGTRLAPTAVQANDNLGLFSFRGHNGSVMGGSRATITAQAAGNFTVSSTPTRLLFGTTPVGSTTVQTVLEITPDAKVKINGAALNVPDYVFEDNYALMPLDELRAFIDEHGHLPGIAPAGEVAADGLDLAGSQMDLLLKVEELTLYTLEQQAHMKQQQGELDTLKRDNARLQSRVDRVEQLEAQVALLMRERESATHLAPIAE